MPNGFHEYALHSPRDLFEELACSAVLEDVGKGRRGGVLTRVDGGGRVPLVRTTTPYRLAAQRFAPVHEALARRIEELAMLPLRFNNALIESYTSAYTKMGSHSDQALDLADDSAIALLSYYKHPAMASSIRELVVEPKGSDGSAFAMPLHHDHVVVFTVDTNRRFRHKIGLSAAARRHDNPWLGITFRTSKTLVQFHEGSARFIDGTSLTLANAEQRDELLRLRGRENREIDFVYPRLCYTLSASDLLPPA